MMKWEDNEQWRKEYENYVNYLENKDCLYNNYCSENDEYYEKLDSLKMIIESMSVIKEVMYTQTEEDIIKWTKEGMNIEINEIIPEDDIFRVSIHIKPMKSKNNKYETENIIYFYEIENEYISRNLIYSKKCASIFDAGDKVIEEFFSILKIFLTQ